MGWLAGVSGTAVSLNGEGEPGIPCRARYAARVPRRDDRAGALFGSRSPGNAGRRWVTEAVVALRETHQAAVAIANARANRVNATANRGNTSRKAITTMTAAKIQNPAASAS